MAQHIPKSGYNSMLKDGAKHFSGLEEAVYRNIQACKELAVVTRTSFGPNGMNKMVINHLDKLFVTNDAATITRELEIQHPAAKMLVMSSQRQEEDLGDGTNFVLVFAGELLEQAEGLLRMGLSPAEVIEGYEKASKKALELLDELVTYTGKDAREINAIKIALRTAVGSKQYGNEDFLCGLIAEACLNVVPKNVANFNVDNVRVAKILGSGIHDSRVIRGMVFAREGEGFVSQVENAKIAVYSCPLDVAQTETKGTVLLKNAEDLKNFSSGEETILEKQIKEIADTGVKLVVSGGRVGDMVLHFLNRYNLMVVKIQSKFELRRLCKATGATALARMGAPTKEEIGHCDKVYGMEIGETRVTVFEQTGDDSGIATIVIRGSTENIMDDVERAVDDGVNVFKAMAKDGRYLPGAGATEIELARRIAAFGETAPGLEQYAIKRFGAAFETIPRALAENRGVNSTELLSKLYAAHHAGKASIGFDIEGEGTATVDATEAKIFDLLATKHSAIRMATNAAVTVLRVDQIIMARQAGGPKPKTNRDWDED
eukprot:Opistho-2@2777